MTPEIANPFRFANDESVPQQGRPSRRRRRAARLLAAIVSVSLAVLPIGTALAEEQVLEIPQVTTGAPPAYDSASATYSGRDAYDNGTPDSYVDPAAGTTGPTAPPDTVAANDKSYPPDPNVGSISDYQNQAGENAQPRIPLGRGAQRNEPPSSITTNLIVGGLIVGLVALEIASHHHHR